MPVDEGVEAVPAAAAEEAAVPVDMDSLLEVMAWWPSQQLQAAIDVFAAANPGVSVDPIALNEYAYRQELAVRTEAGTLPDSWQVLPGFDLLGEAMGQERSAPIGWLYDEENWREQFPEDMLNMVQIEGEYYQVPVSIRRGNALWYNADVLEQAGFDVQPIGSLDELLEMSQSFESTGKRLLCMRPAYLAQLFENTAVGVLGAGGYVRLWGGAPESDADAVGQAVNVFGQLMSEAQVSDAAVDEFIAGECAFLAEHAWAYVDLSTAANSDRIGWMAFPGDEAFVTHADGFSLAQGDNPWGTAWLRAVGSKEVQVALSRNGFSICARTDCDDSAVSNAYQKWVQDDYKKLVLTPSYVDGAGAIGRESTLLFEILQQYREGVLSESDVVDRFVGGDGPFCTTCLELCCGIGLWFCCK